MVKAIVVHGSETWAMTEMDMKRLGIWDREILRRIHGPVVQQGLGTYITKQELRELYTDADIVADIKNKIMEWSGHVVRMNEVKGTLDNIREQTGGK